MDLYITSNLANILKGVNKGAAGHISKMLGYYTKQYKSVLERFNGATAANSFLGHMDGIIKEALEETEHKISCKKGCSHCCEIMVDVTGHEAILIVEWCKQKEIEIDQKKLSIQKSLTQKGWINSPDKTCVFLKDNLCSIYEVRPMSCRSYFVVTPPRKCKTGVTKFVAMFIDYKIEVLFSAVVSLSPSLPMPKALLDIIKSPAD